MLVHLGGRGQDRGLERGVADLDPRVLDGASDPDLDRRLAVQEGVGHELGDTELGALGELPTPDVLARPHHPLACVMHAAGTGAQGEGWPIQRHRACSRLDVREKRHRRC